MGLSAWHHGAVVVWLPSQGTDFTLFSKSVGFVTFRRENVVLPGRAPSAAKRRRFVDVLPLNNDWSAGYQERVQQMVAARNKIRQDMLGLSGQLARSDDSGHLS